MPTSRWMAFSSTCICLRSLRSSAPSGSSSSSTDGRLTSARASATRWRWPPESSEGRERSRPVSCTSSSASADPRLDLRLGDLAPLEAERDVVLDVEVLEQRVALEDRVDVALVTAAPRRPARRRGRSRPRSGCSKPATIRSVVVFPQPDGPSSEKNSPCSITRSRSRHRLRVAEALGHALEAHRLAHAPSLPSSTPMPALAPAQQPRQEHRERDGERRDREHQRPDRVDRRRHAEADRRPDPHGQRLRRLARGEEREHEVVEGEREHQQRARRGSPATAPGSTTSRTVCSWVAPRSIAACSTSWAEARQPRAHDHRHVGDRERDVGDHDRAQRQPPADLGEEQEGGRRPRRSRASRAGSASARWRCPPSACARGRARRRAACRGTCRRSSSRTRSRGSRSATRSATRSRRTLVPLEREAAEALQRALVVEREQHHEQIGRNSTAKKSADVDLQEARAVEVLHAVASARDARAAERR